MKAVTCVLTLLFSLPFYTLAQEDLVAKGNKQFENMEYAYATGIYEKVVAAGYGSQEVYQRLADGYYFQAKYHLSVPYYEQYLRLESDPAPEYYYRYAQCLRAQGKYTQADQQMGRFMAVAEDDLRSEKFIQHRNYLEEIALQSDRYVLDTLAFNSEASDFAPASLDNMLVFASSKGRGSPQVAIDRWSGGPFFDLYVIDTANAVNQEESGLKIKGLVNTQLHESTTAFSPDGRTMYFTTNNTVMNDPERDSTGVTRLCIKRARRDDKNRWGDVEDLSINSVAYSTAHPALTPDGKTLFFVSDRPGGFGASDIWKVAIDKNGNPGVPENLGNLINTPGRESYPFVNENRELFFAGDGHPGLGGLDVFVSRLNDLWEPADLYNIGAPVNSPADDFGYMEIRTNKKGYFASNREGGKGSDDIYGFRQLKPLNRKCEAIFAGQVFDQADQPLQGVTLTLRNEAGEVSMTGKTDQAGDFDVVYDCEQVNFVRVEKEGYESLEVYVNDKSSFVFIMIPDRVRLFPGVDLSEVLDVQPVYFGFDAFTISEEAAADLQKIVAVMEEYPELKIEVRAYTDSRGAAAYNQQLSEKRAAATVAYLEGAGIDVSRLSAKGYGESQPLVDCGADHPCTQEEHAKNRRSAFVIME